MTLIQKDGRSLNAEKSLLTQGAKTTFNQAKPHPHHTHTRTHTQHPWQLVEPFPGSQQIPIVALLWIQHICCMVLGFTAPYCPEQNRHGNRQDATLHQKRKKKRKKRACVCLKKIFFYISTGKILLFFGKLSQTQINKKTFSNSKHLVPFKSKNIYYQSTAPEQSSLSWIRTLHLITAVF